MFKARLVFALCVFPLLLAATCHVPTFGGGTGGTPATGGTTGGMYATGGLDSGGGTTSDTGGLPGCEWVASRGERRAAERPRIVNGDLSSEGEFPWMAAIETGYGWQYCGATVIASRWLLGAAHCQVETEDVAHMGTVDLRETGLKVPITQVRNNPSWSGTASGNDVALMRLAVDVPIEPIALAVNDISGTPVAIGWGATCEGCSTTPLLRKRSLNLVSNADCAKSYPGKITDDMLCAMGDGDACQGDSGGPLAIRAPDGSWVQVGITSWGKGCDRPGVPGVYERVSAVWKWIAACID